MKLRTCLILASTLSASLALAQSPAYLATGIKLVEPGFHEITIWVRTTSRPHPASIDGPLPVTRLIDPRTEQEIVPHDNRVYPEYRPQISLPAGTRWEDICGAAPAQAGEVRARYRLANDVRAEWTTTPWQATDPSRDCTGLIRLKDLQPGSRYSLLVESRGLEGTTVDAGLAGGFDTAPLPTANVPVRFCIMTCEQFEDRDDPGGFKIYRSMLRLKPSFMVNTGDAVYYDHGPVKAINRDLARYKWARMFGLASLHDFYRQTDAFFLKDDHDTLADDSEPGESTGDLSFADGQLIFREQTGLPQLPYRTARWGRHLQVWLMEGRDYRAEVGGEEQAPTIWGEAQIDWLEQSLQSSDAEYRVVITPSPVVGPDQARKADNYANARFAVEGQRIRAMLARHKNLVVVTGDRHWQYVSVDPASGLEEWSVGAASDAHAGGWNETTPRPMHRFLRTGYGGFFSGEIVPSGAGAHLILRLHDCDGKVVYEETR